MRTPLAAAAPALCSAHASTSCTRVAPLQGCPEDQLTPEALARGYRHSDAAALGFTPARELQLTLTDQPPAFYAAASLAYWRKSVRQQLQGPARQLAAKRRAAEVYNEPLSSAAAAQAAVQAGSGATAAAPPPPRFPQQSSRGLLGQEGAEAWVREQLAAPGAPPLLELGWGEGQRQLPHAFPRAQLFELLAELAPPLPRALWLLRVLGLNRTRCVLAAALSVAVVCALSHCA